MLYFLQKIFILLNKLVILGYFTQNSPIFTHFSKEPELRKAHYFRIIFAPDRDVHNGREMVAEWS